MSLSVWTGWRKAPVLDAGDEREDRGHDRQRAKRDGEAVALHLVHPVESRVEECGRRLCWRHPLTCAGEDGSSVSLHARLRERVQVQHTRRDGQVQRSTFAPLCHVAAWNQPLCSRSWRSAMSRPSARVNHEQLEG